MSPRDLESEEREWGQGRYQSTGRGSPVEGSRGRDGAPLVGRQGRVGYDDHLQN